MMKTGIRFKIFIPVFIVLAIFPIASYLIFGMTSKNYMDALARKDLDILVNQANVMISEAAQDASADDEIHWPSRVRELLQDIKSHLRTENVQADMLIFSSKYKLVYPKEENVPREINHLYNYCLDVLEKGKSTAIMLEDTSVTLDGQTYMIRLIHMPGEGNLRAKYMIAYMPVQDHTSLLNAAGWLVFVITATLALLSSVIVWLVAGNLQKPLQTLCRHAGQIGRKDFSPLEQEFSVHEMDDLREAVNHMSDMLARSEQMQSTFFQNVSHELRTPLMSICGYAQGIEQGIFPDQKKAAAIIASESLRMKELVDGILTISKLDNANISLHLCSICLNDFIEEHLERLGGMKNLSSIEVTFSNPEGEVMIETDTELLLNVLRNILSNCMKYAHRQVRVQLTDQDKNAVIVIEDDGDGFTPEDLTHIFERFYKGKNGNFGIGLSVAKASVEYMSGTIDAHNGDNGAAFRITLPKSQPASGQQKTG